MGDNQAAASPDFVIDISGANRWFGDVQALTNFSMQVESGTISVLLGPNGAGKTTAIRMITGALAPQEGAISVFGLDPSGPQGETVRRQCGVVSAKPSLYDRLSGWENLRYAAELYGLGRGSATDRTIGDAAKRFGIDQALDHQVGGYSTGMKTRLALARSILHEPELLLLDEPTSGLDPESALAVLELIRTLTDEGRTVLMCTHLLLEAEGLADSLVVMQHGTCLVEGAPAQLAAHYWPHPMVRISARNTSVLNHAETHPAVRRLEIVDGQAELELTSAQVVPELIRSLVDGGAEITAVQPFEPTLEDIYFAVRRDHDKKSHSPVTRRPSRKRPKMNTQ